MPPLSKALADGSSVAHPVASHPHVDVPLLLVALGVAAVVVLAATVGPAGSEPRASSRDLSSASWWGGLSRPQWLVRGASIGVLLVAVAAGRLGSEDELENIAPALTIGAGWPLLLAAALVVGPLWRWIDPWDALARWGLRTEVASPSGHVWPAVAFAVGWWWFLAVYPRPLEPRAVGTALLVYTTVTLAGCVAFARARWMSSAEPIGLILTWVGLVPRRRLGAWQPPRGASVLLGVVIGGALFALLKRTELWSGAATSPRADIYAHGALLTACLGGGCLTAMVRRLAGSDQQRDAVARALVPAAAGLLLAFALARNRFFTSVQLLPGLIGDPWGQGWDLLGATTAGLDPAPLGAAGLLTLQLAVVTVTHVVGAVIASRPLVGDERLPVIAVLTTTSLLSVVAVSLH